MMRNRFTLPALLGLALAACQQLAADADIDTDNQVNAAETVSADVGSLPPSEQGGTPLATDNAVGPIDETEDDSENSPSTAVIPTQYRGRWGMNANDCDPRRSDNKGLMTVRDTSIRFYEATASLQEQRPAIATSFSGTFSVAGEGQTWERVMTFTRTGDRLKRVDALGSYSYTRCV